MALTLEECKTYLTVPECFTNAKIPDSVNITQDSPDGDVIDALIQLGIEDGRETLETCQVDDPKTEKKSLDPKTPS